MKYTGLELFMENLKQLITCNDNPLINDPLILAERPKFKLLYEELFYMMQTLFTDEDHEIHELEKVKTLKKRFKDVADEAQDIIDLYVSSVTFRNRGLFPNDLFITTFLNLEDVMKSIESIQLEFVALQYAHMKLDSFERTDGLQQMLSAAAAAAAADDDDDDDETTSSNRHLSSVVGLEDDVRVIVEKLIEDQKRLDFVSIVGMGGIGKTTLATKVFNDPFVVYHFPIRAWVTVSQKYEKRDVLIQLLVSMGVQLDVDKSSDSRLREILHKKLKGQKYLIVIDDIWSKEAWDNLKLFFPRDDNGSRILLTSRLSEVAVYAKRHGFIYFLRYLTENQSVKLYWKKACHGEERPKLLIKAPKQNENTSRRQPLAVVFREGVLANEATSKDFSEKDASSLSSYIVSDQKGYLETLALSFDHLPPYLRGCFLYLGGFPKDHTFRVRRLIWLWVAEGLIHEDGNHPRSLEDIAEAYLLDLIDRNLLIVTKRKSNGSVKTCKVHDLVRKLCREKGEEERFFRNIEINKKSSLSQPCEIFTPYKARRIFTNKDICIVNFTHPCTPSIRSLLCFHNCTSMIYDDAAYYRSFALLRVLDLQNCPLVDFPDGIALLVHLRYLAIWLLLGFPSSICNLWNLQTLIVKKCYGSLVLPRNISRLVNLRHLWSDKDLYLPSIEKPMNLQTISNVVLGDRVESFQKCFPHAKKLASTLYSHDENDFEILRYLETLKLSYLCRTRKSNEPESPTGEPNCGKNIHISFPSTLKKLTLVRCHLPWSKMSIIQSLPNLEVLKLIDNAFIGSHWNTGEEEFQSLKFLRLDSLNIEVWEASSDNFPCLTRLVLNKCMDLQEIPLEIGDIPTLELIEVDVQSQSILESVDRLQKELHDMGNYDLKINIHLLGSHFPFQLKHALQIFPIVTNDSFKTDDKLSEDLVLGPQRLIRKFKSSEDDRVLVSEQRVQEFILGDTCFFCFKV